METSTRERLIEAGMAMLLRRGYNHLGIQDLLAETNVPKGSFYHHFESKEAFALAVVDRYMVAAHTALDACLTDEAHAPLERIRNFFGAIRESYRSQGYLGCLLGGLGQELSGINDAFRKRIDGCLSQIAAKLEVCFRLAIKRGDLAAGADARHLATLLVNCWEGAALRCRLLRDPAPLGEMLDFYFAAVAIPGGSRPSASKRSRARPSASARRSGGS
jgi:TetR/AcrR family transcriptional repressor of nem operon